MSEPRPELAGVLETALYHDRAEAEAMARFYAETMGLPRVSSWGDGAAYRLGAGVILLFDRDRLAERDEPIAAHGTTGPSHLALTAAPGSYEQWRERLRGEGIEISHEEEWPGDRRSFYFSDPAGNLLEIASADLWPGAGPE